MGTYPLEEGNPPMKFTLQSESLKTPPPPGGYATDRGGRVGRRAGGEGRGSGLALGDGRG